MRVQKLDHNVDISRNFLKVTNSFEQNFTLEVFSFAQSFDVRCKLKRLPKRNRGALSVVEPNVCRAVSGICVSLRLLHCQHK